MNFSLNKALVTGGAGFIGSHLVDTLIENGCNVIVIDDLSTGHFSNIKHLKNRITFINGDIKDQKLIEEHVKECDVIFHLAAVVSVQKTIDHPIDTAMINEIGTLSILEAARKNSVGKVVISSSSAVYGNDPELPKHEGMEPKLGSPYAIQKLIGEMYADLYSSLFGLNVICLRYFNVYGPRQDPNSPYSGVISIFMSKAVKNEIPVIYGDGNQYRDFVFVKDVVKANILAAHSNNKINKVINIGTGRYTKINELWEMINKMNNTKIRAEFKPARPGDIIKSVANNDLAKRTLCFEPEFSFEKGIEQTFNWYRTPESAFEVFSE